MRNRTDLVLVSAIAILLAALTFVIAGSFRERIVIARWLTADS